VKEKTAVLSVLVNLALAVLKIAVGILAHSASVLAEGIHSGMDIFSSGISLIGIITANKPEDRRHPYGHYKFEVMAGLLIAMILFATGLWIVYQAYRRIVRPEPLELTSLALGMMLVSAIVNLLMARMKIHYGKKEGSASLLSDGIHSRVDVFTSLAVLIGVALTRYWIRADSFLALAVGLYIIKESFFLGKESTDCLLDASAGEEVEKTIKEIAVKEKVEISELRTQKKGMAITANLIIDLPGDLNIDQATGVAENLKKALMQGIQRLKYVAVQIKSHDLATATFQPYEPITGLRIGRGIGWRRRGVFEEARRGANPSGRVEYCLCEKCGFRMRHERGLPCSRTKCPECGAGLKRER